MTKAEHQRQVMSYRNIGIVAKCSHGSVSAERRSMKKEEAELKRKIEEQAEQEKKMHESTVLFPETTRTEQPPY